MYKIKWNDNIFKKKNCEKNAYICSKRNFSERVALQA